jgi:hypothetical protein
MTAWLRGWGVDRVVLILLLTQAWTALAGLGTLLLVLKLLNPLQLGLYYAVTSVAALQLFFDLGLTQLLVRMVSQRSPGLALSPRGDVLGDPGRRSALRPLAKFIYTWYRRAAIWALPVLCLAGFFLLSGEVVFSKFIVLAVVLAAAGVGGILWIMPSITLLEGLGDRQGAAWLRLLRVVVQSLALWAGLLLGLQAVASGLALLFAALAVGFAVGCNYAHLKSSLLSAPSNVVLFDWKKEILPLQWRVALCWGSAFLTQQALAPLAIKTSGLAVGGQVGMSMSLYIILFQIVPAWVGSKTSVFGRWWAEGRLAEAQALFRRACFGGLSVAFLAHFFVGVALLLAQKMGLPYTDRFLDFVSMAWLMVAGMGNAIITALVMFIRSFHGEPFVWMFIVYGLSTLLFGTVAASQAGATGLMIAFAATTWLIAVPWTWIIYRHQITSMSAHAADNPAVGT